MWKFVERILSIAVAIAAVTMAAIVIRRELRPVPTGFAPQKPEYVATWASIPESGVELANPSGSIRLVEFSDLECPFCKRFQKTTVDTLRRRFPQLSIKFIHTPLSIHRFAEPAAFAAECAGAQGGEPAFIEAVFSKQDSLGLKTWTSFAKDARIDTSQFGRCMSSRPRFERLEADAAIVARLGIHATPSVMLEGWLFRSGISDTALVRMVSQLAAGQSPKAAIGVTE
jgi:protein-disulfide isomerase